MLTVIYILHQGTQTYTSNTFIPTVHFVHLYQNLFVWSQSLLLWPRLCATGSSVFWMPACRAGKSQQISRAPSPSSSGTSNWPWRWCLETWRHQPPNLTETFWFSVQSVEDNKRNTKPNQQLLHSICTQVKIYKEDIARLSYRVLHSSSLFTQSLSFLPAHLFQHLTPFIDFTDLALRRQT